MSLLEDDKERKWICYNATQLGQNTDDDYDDDYDDDDDDE